MNGSTTGVGVAIHVCKYLSLHHQSSQSEKATTSTSRSALRKTAETRVGEDFEGDVNEARLGSTLLYAKKKRVGMLLRPRHESKEAIGR